MKIVILTLSESEGEESLFTSAGQMFPLRFAQGFGSLAQHDNPW
jgi:hypothetical protein